MGWIKKICLCLVLLVTAGILYATSVLRLDPEGTPYLFQSAFYQTITTTLNNLIHSRTNATIIGTHTSEKQNASLNLVHKLSSVLISSGPGKPTHHIYSAYYDSRQLPNRPAIVMIGYVSKRNQDKIYCKFIYEDNSTKCIGNVVHYSLLAPDLQPENYFCRMNSSDEIPTFIVVSDSGKCEGNWTPLIPVQNREKREKDDIGVCVQSALVTGRTMTNKKILDLLVEFLAMVKVLGAKIVTVYSTNVKYEILELIVNLYPGFVDMIQWDISYRGKLHYSGQDILLNDCLYRNMNRVTYLAFIDIDEIIYPVSNNSWIDMLQILEKKGNYASYTFPNNFIDEVVTDAKNKHSCRYKNLPRYFVRIRRLHSLNRNSRQKMIVKADVLSAICVHIMCKETVSGYQRTFLVPMEIGFMAHYRESVPTWILYVPTWFLYGSGVIDKTALKYKEKVMEELQRVCSLMESFRHHEIL